MLSKLLLQCFLPFSFLEKGDFFVSSVCWSRWVPLWLPLPWPSSRWLPSFAVAANDSLFPLRVVVFPSVVCIWLSFGAEKYTVCLSPIIIDKGYAKGEQLCILKYVHFLKITKSFPFLAAAIVAVDGCHGLLMGIALNRGFYKGVSYLKPMNSSYMWNISTLTKFPLNEWVYFKIWTIR